MSATFATFGNDLHAGRRILPIVSRRRTWYLISVVVVVLLGALAVVRGPNLGIEFTGGSEFQIAGVADTEQSSAREVVREHLPDNEPKVTQLGSDTLRVQTEELDSAETAELAGELATAYGVSADAVSTSYIGPVWSGDVTQKMARGVVVFLVLVAGMMALYFRDLKASLAAMIALGHDMLLTAAVYGVVGFEITPGTVIGFLTVMGYSLYDTIVVFDKVRENTADLTGQRRRTFAELVELAANQTLVRSINTSVVALLPIGSILAIGAFLLGAGTLKDAVNEALRDWTATFHESHYLLGTAAGPHPFPRIVKEFHRVISAEARAQILERTGGLPDVVVACVGGGSNAIGMFAEFIDDEGVELIGAEPGGEGFGLGAHGAAIAQGTNGLLHGTYSYLMCNEDGQVEESYSISAGLDYPGVGPEHAHLAKSGRASYVPVTDDAALDAFQALSRHEGIIPALESSHALAYALQRAAEHPADAEPLNILVALSGRGDKDIAHVRATLEQKENK